MNDAEIAVKEPSLVSGPNPFSRGDSGQATMANSLPVVLASDQSAIPVTTNAGPNSSTAALALEAGGNLAAISTATGTQADVAYVSGNGSIVTLLKGIWTRLRGGQALMANSLPVVLSSDQSAVAVSVAQFSAARLAAPALALPTTADVLALQMVSNGTTADPMQNNLEGVALASAVRAATTLGADIINYNARGVTIYLNISVAPGVDTLTVSLDIKDPASGLYNQYVRFADPVAAVGLRVYQFYPTQGTGPVSGGGSGVVQNGALPRTWRVRVTHSAATSFTYSVGYSYTV